MSPNPEVSGTSVVMLGHFNPLIFRPEWFAKKEIITQADADAAEIGVVHPEIVAFGIKPWIKLSVEQQKFSAGVVQDPNIKLFDFIVKCFSNLPETPVAKLGINRELHFNLETEERWHALGDILAPKEPWGDFLMSSDHKRKGGLLSIVMQQKPRDDGFNGQFMLKAEPSSLMRYGIFFQFNDHYDLTEDDTLTDARVAIEILKKQWEPSLSKAESIISSILAKV